MTLEQGDGRASHPVGRRHGHPIAYPREEGMPPAKRGPPGRLQSPTQALLIHGGEAILGLLNFLAWP